MHPKHSVYSICVLNHSFDDWTDRGLSLLLVINEFFTSSWDCFLLISMLLMVDPTSSKLLILSLIPRQRGQNGYGLYYSLSSSGLFNLFVSLTTVGTVLTLYLSWSRVKNCSINRSVDPKLGAACGFLTPYYKIWANGPC